MSIALTPEQAALAREVISESLTTALLHLNRATEAAKNAIGNAVREDEEYKYRLRSAIAARIYHENRVATLRGIIYALNREARTESE